LHICGIAAATAAMVFSRTFFALKRGRTSDPDLPKTGVSRSAAILGSVLALLITTLGVLFEGVGKDIAERSGLLDLILKPKLQPDKATPVETSARSEPGPSAPDKLAPQGVASVYVTYSGDGAESPLMANMLADALKRAKFNVVHDPAPHVMTIIVAVSNLDAPRRVENATVALFNATATVSVETRVDEDESKRIVFSVPGSATAGREEVQDDALQDAASTIIRKLPSPSSLKSDR